MARPENRRPPTIASPAPNSLTGPMSTVTSAVSWLQELMRTGRGPASEATTNSSRCSSPTDRR
ncbi:Uncharacterised protein [Mycobacteroides abscessus subsp. abscessus]|nr:Uncharacterised protein [Mycobacteroides abscessus subsp. abscessus]